MIIIVSCICIDFVKKMLIKLIFISWETSISIDLNNFFIFVSFISRKKKRSRSRINLNKFMILIFIFDSNIFRVMTFAFVFFFHEMHHFFIFFLFRYIFFIFFAWDLISLFQFLKLDNSSIRIESCNFRHRNVFMQKTRIKNFYFFRFKYFIIIRAKIANDRQFLFLLRFLFKNSSRLFNQRSLKKFSSFWIIFLTRDAHFHQHVVLVRYFLFVRWEILAHTKDLHLYKTQHNVLSLKTKLNNDFMR